MKSSCLTSLASIALAGTASASIFRGNQMVPPPLEAEASWFQKRATGQGSFDQLIDHANPSLGTFPMRFWWSDTYYAGPGSPVVFFTPGEIDAAPYTGYLTNRTITGLFAQAIGAAVVMMEHRYWGTSTPYTTLTTKNLQHLNLANSIYDTTYFANKVQLPFDSNGTSTASKAPWIFSGGSYSGALSAWVNAIAPGTFWAYHSSSGVVESIDNFWQYFHPVQEGMPKNCSADVSRVIEHVDRILKGNDATAKQAIKTKFGLGDIVHDADFASALQNGPWGWQAHDVATGYSGFYRFCDYVENQWPGSNATAPGEEGVGLCKALNGYAKWTKEIMLPGYCAGYGYWGDDQHTTACFDSYNATSPFFTDYSMSNNVNRQWNWFLCNEPFKFWQNGAPENVPTIVSRLVNSAYWERQCSLLYPEEDGFTYGIAKGKGVKEVNAYTGGWDYVNTTRLVWVNGEFDPWRDATVSSTFRPGGPLQSTEQAPVLLIPGGIHCSDLLARNGAANAGVQKVIDSAVSIIKGWTKEYYTERGITRDFAY